MVGNIVRSGSGRTKGYQSSVGRTFVLSRSQELHERLAAPLTDQMAPYPTPQSLPEFDYHLTRNWPALDSQRLLELPDDCCSHLGHSFQKSHGSRSGLLAGR